MRWGFERAGEVMPVVPLDALVDAVVGNETRIGVLLPPFVEPSFLVESWEACNFLPQRFGCPAHIASVSTFVDADCAVDHLASATPLSRHGWGRSDRDRRTVADVLCEQIESATHLALVGPTSPSGRLARLLTVLNPGASPIPLRSGSGRDDFRVDAAAARSVPVVPPWLAALQGECDPAPRSDLFVYRRARPFDPGRFGDWLANPPRDLVRGKGHVWLASDPDQIFGYSCAGSVHRLFPAGRWWASRAHGAWPSCTSQRRRLLERWHPHFGDRRQELVFAGVDLDPDRLCAGLDACLLPEETIDDALHASRAEGSGVPSTPRTKLH
ncbi:MAG: GTP-binding protein [Myxococcota bacterium]|nr:GTP-binding protein [Myxococcota bacterium]